MNTTLIVIVSFVTGLWLAILTLVVVLLVRQLGLVTLRLSRGGLTNFVLEDDGPEVGSEIPAEVVELLPRLTAETPTYLIMFSSSCVPCREVAASLGDLSFVEPIIALVAGSGELATALIDLLPSGIDHVRDPTASKIAEALNIRSTPFAVKIANRIIRQKKYLFQVTDLESFMETTPLVTESSLYVNRDIVYDSTIHP